MHFCTIAAATLIAASTSGASASTITELTDAGRSMATAFDVSGGTTAVYGTIENTTISDADLFSFRLLDPTRLTMRILSAEFDTNMLLFNDVGQGLAGVDDQSDGCDNSVGLSRSDSCLSIDLTAGIYFLGVGANNMSAFETVADAATGSNDILENDDGVFDNPLPEVLALIGSSRGDRFLEAEGSYLLDFSSAVYAASDPSVVPLPAGLPLLLAGLGGLAVVRRLKARASLSPNSPSSQDWTAA